MRDWLRARGEHLPNNQIDKIGLESIAVLQRTHHVGREQALDRVGTLWILLYLRIHMLDDLLEDDVDFGTSLMADIHSTLSSGLP